MDICIVYSLVARFLTLVSFYNSMLYVSVNVQLVVVVEVNLCN